MPIWLSFADVVTVCAICSLIGKCSFLNPEIAVFLTINQMWWPNEYPQPMNEVDTNCHFQRPCQYRTKVPTVRIDPTLLAPPVLPRTCYRTPKMASTSWKHIGDQFWCLFQYSFKSTFNSTRCEFSPAVVRVWLVVEVVVQIQDGDGDSVGKQERATPPAAAAGDKKLFSEPFSEILGLYSILGVFVFWVSWQRQRVGWAWPPGPPKSTPAAHTSDQLLV